VLDRQTAGMGLTLAELDDRLMTWIGEQHLFFVATAPAEGGHVNLSPKGHDTFRVLGPRQVAYLDLTGSGAETIAHTRQNGRITIMFCAFEGSPLILRLFGTGTAHPIGTPGFDELGLHFDLLPGTRSIVSVELDMVRTACGYSVPQMTYEAERPTLLAWAERRGDDGLAEYWADRNTHSIDGLPALG
jgi:hypothetical protein